MLGLAAMALAAALGGAAPRPPIRLGPPPPATVRRVVTVAPSLTETVLALGAGDRLVGVSRFDDAPAVRGLPRVGGYTDPSVEAVIALAPDLVLAEPSPGNRAAVERMAALGAPVLAVGLTSKEEILSALREVGAALGLAGKGKALADELSGRIGAVRTRARALKPLRALVVFDWEPLVVGGPGSFAETLLGDTGATNAAAGLRGAYPVLGAELVMATSPEVVVDAAYVSAPPRERLLRLPGLASARLVVASPSLFRPGPRLGDALEELLALLHPEAAAKPAPDKP